MTKNPRTKHPLVQALDNREPKRLNTYCYFASQRPDSDGDDDGSGILYRLALASASPSQDGRNACRQTRSTQDTISLSIVSRVESLDSLIAAVDALARSFVRENLSRSSRSVLLTRRTTRSTDSRRFFAKRRGSFCARIVARGPQKNTADREAAGRLKARYSYPALLLLTP